jgi:hypothetical protein
MIKPKTLGKYPDFLCIGAQKAGTTWLHNVLKIHPDIWLPDRKEIHFFDKIFLPFQSQKNGKQEFRPKNSIKGEKISWITEKKARFNRYNVGRCLWEGYYRFFPKNNHWYRRLFSPAGNRITGDFTPAYSLLDGNAVNHIAKIMPDTKIVFIMRDPIERAWSNAKMVLGLHGRRTITRVSKTEFISHVASHASRVRGDYSRIISTWEKYFGKSKFLTLFFDHIVEKPKELIAETTTYLEVGNADEIMLDAAKKIVHKGQILEMPKEVHKFLFEIYKEELIDLAKRFGEVPNKWIERAERKLKDGIVP